MTQISPQSPTSSYHAIEDLGFNIRIWGAHKYVVHNSVLTSTNLL